MNLRFSNLSFVNPWLSILLILASQGNLAEAEGIATDGSVGAMQQLTGANIAISEQLGSRVGANLFHSFSNFNINPSQTVTFTEAAPGALDNIFTRVTGGETSMIDGTLRVTPGGHANFFFFNPAGVVFGKDAHLDVSGAFHVSTANQLNFVDGGKFSADLLQQSELSSAQPESFGFLTGSAQTNALLAIDGADLQTSKGQGLDLVAGNISINDAQLRVQNGDIRLVATQAPANVSVQFEHGVLPLPKESPEQGGTITSHNSSLYSLSNGGGRVGIWGHTIALHNDFNNPTYFVSAWNVGNQKPSSEQGVLINSASLDLQNVSLATSSRTQGDAGPISVNTGSFNAHLGYISSATGVSAQGSSGDITIEAETIAFDQITLTSSVESSESGLRTGDITVHAHRDFTVDGASQIGLQNYSDGAIGRLSLESGGNLTLNNRVIAIAALNGNSNSEPGQLVIKAGGDFNLNSRFLIHSGSQRKTASMAIDVGHDFNFNGEIWTYNTDVDWTPASGYAGSTGDIAIHTGGVFSMRGKLTNELINPSFAAGGNIRIEAEDGIHLDNASIDIILGRLGSGPGYEQGPGGNIELKTQGNVVLDRSSTISNLSTYNGARSGDILVDAVGSITLDRTSNISAVTVGAGDAGSTRIQAGQDITVDHESLIGSNSVSSVLTQTVASGNGGSLQMSAGRDINLLNGSNITTSTHGNGRAGDLTINADGKLSLTQSVIASANSGGLGAAGNIALNAAVVKLDGGGVISSSTPVSSIGIIKLPNVSGKTGNITVNATQSINLVNSRDNNARLGSRGGISLENSAKVSDAEAQTIAPGKISLNAPVLNIEESEISAASLGNIAAGGIALNASQRVNLIAADIHTNAHSGDGGAIALNGGELLNLHDTVIRSTVETGRGDGGDITAQGRVMLLDGALLQANAASGNGGAIDLRLEGLIPASQTLVIGGDRVTDLQPDYNIIQAVSQDGVSTTPILPPPQLNLSGVIANLGSPQFDASFLSPEYCNIGAGSTLRLEGRGGLPPKTGDVF